MTTSKVMRIVLVLILSLASIMARFTTPVKASSGSPVIEWVKMISAQSVIQTRDGGYALIRESGDFEKLDSSGNVQWNKTFGGPNDDQANCVVGTDDGGYAIAGTCGNYGPGGHNGFLLKTDSVGDEEWSKGYGCPWIYAGIQTADGGYALGGSPWLVKTDSVGDVQWQMGIAEGRSLVQTEDGGYVVACSGCLVKVSPFPRHNIAITQVTTKSPQVQGGDILPINVTILNDGNYNETANVTLYYDLIQIDSQTIVIQTDTSKTLTFFWNTTGVALGQHNILANATVAEETYLIDNIGETTVLIIGPIIGSKISINTVSSISSVVGFYVNVSGTLMDTRGNAISGGHVFLYSKVQGTETWHGLFVNQHVLSETNGYYSAIWIPWATGNFTLTAQWDGNATHFGASNSTTVTVNAIPTISISLSSSTSLIGFKVEINGTLTCSGVGLSGPIFLSYSVTSGQSLNEITVANTVSGGGYSAVWIPTATGYYLVKATWAGDPIVSRTSAMVNLAVIPFKEQDVFAVESNSSISALAFNSTTNELAFTASGPSGTTGYARVFISKELVANMSDLKVRVDETQIDFATASTDASWVLYFLYVHSTHHIIITIVAPTGGGLGYNGNLMYVIIAIVVILTATIVYLQVQKQEKK